jgi:hypothetical protein
MFQIIYFFITNFILLYSLAIFSSAVLNTTINLENYLVWMFININYNPKLNIYKFIIKN